MTPANSEAQARANLAVYLQHRPHDDALVEAYGEASAETHRAFMADIALLLASPPPGGATREEIARLAYEADPHYEGGETVEGFQVTPGGNLTWEQFKDQCAEFGDDPIFHGWEDKLKSHYALADAILALRPVAPPPGGATKGNVLFGRDDLDWSKPIQFENGEPCELLKIWPNGSPNFSDKTHVIRRIGVEGMTSIWWVDQNGEGPALGDGYRIVNRPPAAIKDAKP
jgi:hypothetical protein